MPEYALLDIPENHKLTHNITHFVRALRKAGLPVGPGRVVEAIRAVAGQDTQGWEGGTRIEARLHSFNRDWSRRYQNQIIWVEKTRLMAAL